MREIKKYVKDKKNKNKVIFVYKNKEETYEIISYVLITNTNINPIFPATSKLTLYISNSNFYTFVEQFLMDRIKFDIYLNNKTFKSCFFSEINYGNDRCYTTIYFDYFLIN